MDDYELVRHNSPTRSISLYVPSQHQPLSVFQTYASPVSIVSMFRPEPDREMRWPEEREG